MELLVVQQDDIKYTLPSIQYDILEPLLEEALRTNEFMHSVVVTEETRKTNKKLVAELRKRTDGLNDMRIAIKKKLDEPYNEFKAKIDEIIAVVKAGEDFVRQQEREFEELEREEKRQKLEVIFNKRARTYEELVELEITFEKFFKPSYLTKTMTIDKVEKEMVDWFEAKKRDVGVVKAMVNAPEIMAEYVKHQDLAKAIETVQQRYAETEKIEKIIQKDKTDFIIHLYNKNDYETVIKFIKNNNIQFKGEL